MIVKAVNQGVAAAADVGVKRKPICLAKFLQRAVRRQRVTLAGREHDRPMRRGEHIARRAA